MRIKSILLSLSAIAAVGSSMANAAPLVYNGSFELTSNGGNKQLTQGTSTTVRDRTTLDGWSNTGSNTGDAGYNFVFQNDKVATSESVRQMYKYSSSADGGNLFASDAQYGPGTLYQTISGLTVGQQYVLSFEYAVAQQINYPYSNTNNYWQVGFGNSLASSTTQNTTKITIPNGGFSGWNTASMIFTATGTSQVLSFLAKGGTENAPPFMLLDGVSMEAKAAVPEPSTISLLLGGVGLVGFMARRRRNRKA
jgi:hypothetical protein